MKNIIVAFFTFLSLSVSAQGLPPNCPDTGGNHLNYISSKKAWACGTSSSSTGTVSSITQGTGMSFSVNPITTTGTINLATPVTVANGGTGAAPSGDDSVLVSDSSSAATWRTMPNCTDTGGNHLNYTASTNSFSCGTSSAGGSLSGLTAASGANSINNGDNAQVWNWQITTAAKAAFTFTENTASTSGGASQYLLRVGTIAASTAKPFSVFTRASSTPNIEIDRTGGMVLNATGAIVASQGNSVNITAADAGTSVGGDVNITSGLGVNVGSGSIVLQSPSVSGTGASGGVFGITGNGNSGDSGPISFTTGTPTGSGNRSSGSITLETGDKLNSGTVGSVNIKLANTDTATFKAQHIIRKGSSPTVTANCGSSPSVVGKDEAMLVTVGSGGTATNCTMTFANAFTTNAPVCTANSNTDIVGLKVVTTTTTVAIDATAAFTAGSKLHILCTGWE